MVGTWNSTWPVGTSSVKSNRIPGQNNTTYTEANMKLDHYWNEDVQKDGYHKKIEMPKRTTDVTLANASINGAMYLKEVSASNLRVEGFYRNANGIYQFIPSFKSGSTNIPTGSAFTTLTNVSANSYGEIWIWQANQQKMQKGVFVSNATLVQTYLLEQQLPSGGTITYITFNNNTATVTDLNIKARLGVDGAAGTHHYRIIYWGI